MKELRRENKTEKIVVTLTPSFKERFKNHCSQFTNKTVSEVVRKLMKDYMMEYEEIFSTGQAVTFTGDGQTWDGTVKEIHATTLLVQATNETGDRQMWTFNKQGYEEFNLRRSDG